MEEAQVQRDCPLIEEVIFYGVLEPENLSLDRLQIANPKVGVLKHYKHFGPIQVEGEDEQFQMWAYPDGIKIYDDNLHILNDKNPQHSFGKAQQIGVSDNRGQQHPANYIYSFVHTDYSLNRTYFTALCWHEKMYIPLKEGAIGNQATDIYSYSLPKCTLWELENDPHLVDRDKTLIYLPQVIIIGSKQPLFTYHRQILRFYYRNVLSDVTDPILNVKVMEYFKDLVYVAGYPLAEKEFDETGFQSRVREHREIPRKDLNSFYLSCLFLPKANQQFGQIELIDCPNSPVKVNPVHMPMGQCFIKPNVDLVGVLRRIGVKNFITLWKCVILEKHILVFSMNNWEVIDLFQSLLYLIEPIRWENIYIPFLPFHLASNIDAIQSYLIGMSRIHMNYVIEHYQHQMKDIVLFDLDQNALIQNTLEQAQLPSQIKTTIEQRLTALGFRKDTIFSSFFREQPQQLSQLQKIFRIKCIFFDGLIYLLNNYRPFASMREENLLAFDKEGYLSLFKDQEWKDFGKQLVETMIFVRLCQYHLYEEKILRWNQSNIGGLFVYCQNIISQRHKGSEFWHMPHYISGTWKWPSIPYAEYVEYMVQKNMSSILSKKKVYRVQNYLIKYLSWKEVEQDEKDSSLFASKKEGREQSLLKALVEFIFPWVKDLDISQQPADIKYRLSLRIRKHELVNLQKLFGRIGSDKQNEPELSKSIRNQLKLYRQKKHHYITIKQKKPKQGRSMLVRLSDRASV